jgi:superfamily I DNA and/or RNA helicase
MINEFINEEFSSELDARFFIPKFKLSYATSTALADHIIKNKKFNYQIEKFNDKKKGYMKLKPVKKASLNLLNNLSTELIEKPNPERNRSFLRLKVYTREIYALLGWMSDKQKWFLIDSGDNHYRGYWQLPEAIIDFAGGTFKCEKDTKGLIIQFWREEIDRSLQSISYNYQRHLIETINPFEEYLDAEREILTNDRYSNYVKYSYDSLENHRFTEMDLMNEDEESMALLIVEEPPRSFLRENNWFNLYKKGINGKKKIQSLKLIDHYELDNGFGLLFKKNENQNWPEDGWLRLKPNLHSNRLRRKAVKKLRQPPSIHIQKLADILSRPEGYPEVSRNPVVTVNPIFSRDSKENWKQCSAIDLACSTDDVALIMGPPGTGKTEIICEIIRQVIRKKGRILVTAPTHVAVDNVLERIVGEEEIEAVRVGRMEKVSHDLRNLMLDNKEKHWKKKMQELKKKIFNNKKQANQFETIQNDFFEELKKDRKITLKQSIVDQCNLVCGTLLGISNFQFSMSTEEKPFDLLIVDEASKASLIDFLVPAVRARKWILIGDHRQLPPYINRNEMKCFIDQYLTSKQDNKKRKETITTRETKGETRFSEDVEQISWRLTRFFEENHNLEETKIQERFLKEISKLLEGNRKQIRYLLDIVECALGSCFHYFWRRVDESRKAYLPVQYRMPIEIARFLQKTIYKGQTFKTAKKVKNNGFYITLNPDLFDDEKITNPFTWISPDKNYKSKRNEKSASKKVKGLWHNPLEANIIVNLLQDIINDYPLQKRPKNQFSFNEISNENPFTIGVITFYSRQAKEIRKRVSRLSNLEKKSYGRFKVKDKPISVRISIVDRFQGQEQDIIILSMTRSNMGYKIGFLSNIQRLNVAISRAKQNLIVIGNHDFYKKLYETPEKYLLKAIATECKNSLILYDGKKNNKQRRMKKKSRRKGN